MRKILFALLMFGLFVFSGCQKEESGEKDTPANLQEDNNQDLSLKPDQISYLTNEVIRCL